MSPYNRILFCLVASASTLTGLASPLSASITSPAWMAGIPPACSDSLVAKFELKKIPYKVTYRFDRGLGPGRMQKARDGHDGSVRRIVVYQRSGKKLVSPVVLCEERTQPTDAVMMIGPAGWSSTRGSFDRAKVLDMEATGYSEAETSSRTRLGLRTGYGIVAVDPRVIRLGSRVFVEGYGFAIAGDTGGAIKGNRIDLCFGSRRAAMLWGRRKVRVHVLE
jgi:3D (Asp-Asp-Asp) domain-containing protein